MANNAVRLIAPILLGALILLFPADGLRALGLGEARVDSWLGQPLDVSIRLLEVESEAVESVSVGPASLEDFERLGVPSQSLALGLEVTVDRSASPPVVRVRSQRPVNDPVVQILIDARWASGRVLREYTLFLDPPVTESRAPAREVSEPASQPTQTESRPTEREPAQRPASRPDTAPSRPSEPAPASRGADSVTVSRGDTLWSIAQQWRPDSSLTMDQVMLAIFNRNRGAFLDENINRMLSDTRLDMPDMQEVRSIDRAEAERRIRDHMRSWQPGVTEDVPVVSDAAMPESSTEPESQAAPEPEPQDSEPQEQESRQTEEPASGQADSDSATAQDQDDEDFRLDVVPPEDDEFSESSVVAEGEIEAVSDRLADVEEEIAAEGLERQAFDEHAAEVRDALDQRDMAGLAVAEESLAELESRLREAREARAEEERLGQVSDDESATDSGSEGGDRISDYLQQLEGELRAGGDEDAADGDESLAMTEQDQGDSGMGSDDRDDPSSDRAGAQDETGVDETDATTDGSDASGESSEPADRADTATSDSGGMGWLWPAIGLLVVIAAAAGLFVFMRGRREPTGRAEPSLGDDDAAAAARAAVARHPGDLGAHLSLLRVLADEGREEEFTDAFDQMYQEVDDESAPEWQEALALAAVHVPDHPLLTPHETSIDGPEDELDRRADEMFGMLDTHDADSDSGSALSDDDTFDLDAEDDEDDEGRSSDERKSSESLGEDMDLAVLSERLDDPAGRPESDESQEDDGDSDDFDKFEEIDEYSPEAYAADDDESEAPVSIDEDESDGPDLDFAPSREQEADEVVGESGARDSEELDLEFSSDADKPDSGHTDDGLDFELDDLEDDSDAPEPVPGAGGASGGSAEQEPDEDDVEEPAFDEPEEASSTGGTLSDEDADVKLDLARAYISVDLSDSARTVLEEVISDGSEEKRAEAQKLLDSIV